MIERILDIVYPDNIYCICCGSIIDKGPLTGEETTSHERQVAFTKMMEIALELA